MGSGQKSHQLLLPELAVVTRSGADQEDESVGFFDAEVAINCSVSLGAQNSLNRLLSLTITGSQLVSPLPQFAIGPTVFHTFRHLRLKGRYNRPINFGSG